MANETFQIDPSDFTAGHRHCNIPVERAHDRIKRIANAQKFDVEIAVAANLVDVRERAQQRTERYRIRPQITRNRKAIAIVCHELTAKAPLIRVQVIDRDNRACTIYGNAKISGTEFDFTQVD